ncbi:MAG TPA: site-2 protease family protein [Thermoleophilaceae bacterium]|nr:site-2 protease family protein [Thermoleophilaceae bacterium]
MFGGGSIQLARVFGIRIGVDLSWLIVLFLIIWSLSDYFASFGLAVVGAFLFFASILLHELGHAVVAIRNGIPITGIDLWLFGGVAKLERDTDSPGVEFKVAIAGPIVTLVIAAACFGIGTLIANADDVFATSSFDNAAADDAVAVLGWLAFVNFWLLAFNLIPGFPLDGGRIARAIAWWRTGDRNRATRFAARLGRGFAYVMIGVGVVLFVQGSLVSGVWLAFIGIFLNQAARSAEVQSAISGRIEGLRVADVMDAEPVALPTSLGLDRAEEDYFLRYGWPWFPVVDADRRLVGVITREAVEGTPAGERSIRTVAQAMARVDDGSGLRVRLEDPLEALLAKEALARLGALMAVDADGVLRGVVTVGQLRRALRPVQT